jgi:hypothetical protein
MLWTIIVKRYNKSVVDCCCSLHVATVFFVLGACDLHQQTYAQSVDQPPYQSLYKRWHGAHPDCVCVCHVHAKTTRRSTKQVQSTYILYMTLVAIVCFKQTHGLWNMRKRGAWQSCAQEPSIIIGLFSGVNHVYITISSTIPYMPLLCVPRIFSGFKCLTIHMETNKWPGCSIQTVNYLLM